MVSKLDILINAGELRAAQARPLHFQMAANSSTSTNDRALSTATSNHFFGERFLGFTFSL